MIFIKVVCRSKRWMGQTNTYELKMSTCYARSSDTMPMCKCQVRKEENRRGELGQTLWKWNKERSDSQFKRGSKQHRFLPSLNFKVKVKIHIDWRKNTFGLAKFYFPFFKGQTSKWSGLKRWQSFLIQSKKHAIETQNIFLSIELDTKEYHGK